MTYKQNQPATDLHGNATRKGRVIESNGKWHLCYHGDLDGRHAFTVERVTNRIELYEGISLEEAKNRFAEIVREKGDD